MFNISDKNISYLIVSPEIESNSQLDNKFLCDKLCNILYSKDYTILPVYGYYEGKSEKSFIAIGSNNNNDLRKDVIHLINEFGYDSIITKYVGDENPVKILNDGSERKMKVSIYESNNSGVSYVYNGVSFSFSEEKRYQVLINKSQLREGMIVEFFNNDEWVERTVGNVDIEYEKMYKLLIKYNKLRVCTE